MHNAHSTSLIALAYRDKGTKCPCVGDDVHWANIIRARSYHYDIGLVDIYRVGSISWSQVQTTRNFKTNDTSHLLTSYAD